MVPPRALVQYYREFLVDKMGDVQYLQKTSIVSAAPQYPHIGNMNININHLIFRGTQLMKVY